MNRIKIKNPGKIEDLVDDFSDEDLSRWKKYISEHELPDSYSYQLKKVWHCEFCKATHYMLKDSQVYTEGGDQNKVHIILTA